MSSLTMSTTSVFGDKLKSKRSVDRHVKVTGIQHQQSHTDRIHIGQNLYHVSESVKIEVPHYTGPFLVDQGQIALGRCRKYESVQQKQNQKKVEREDLTNELICLYSNILGGTEYVHLGTLLSHYNTPDIELRLDSDGTAIPVAEWTTLAANKNQRPHVKVAVLLYPFNAIYLLRRLQGDVEMHVSGYYLCKARQLRQFGYQVVEIPHYEFQEAHDKQSYLKQKYLERSRQHSNAA
ncbi:FAST kinase domain-containing protein 3, mitochondrial-like [Haliotis rufescens]|uniref:FAST kinase domain-containing protein 3, mitochondrial-like n=1 Tax=Haliotis rufescens TaxID=6454 RepID=UPI00201F27CC|nr:FAST kinase domain-containing protein 3, mitochondrial-like [Haliotis rufescens]